MSNLGLVALGIAGLFTAASIVISFVSWVDDSALAGRNATLGVAAAVLALVVLKMYEILRK
jgi:hypothetical protein